MRNSFIAAISEFADLSHIPPPKHALLLHTAPSLPSPNAAAWKKPKRVYELTWPLFLGALAEVAVLKTRDLDLERSHAFEIFLDDHVGPLFERRFREASGSDGEAAAMGLQTELGASTAYGGDGVLSRGVVSGVASVRARASRCVITSSNGVMPLVEARDAGLSYTTLNIHDFEPIAGAGLSTRLAVSMALPVAAVGAAGGGAQLFGVHSKGDGLFRRSTPRENGSIDYGGNVLSPNGSSASSIGGWEGVGTYAGADAFGKGPKAGAGLVRGDRYALAILRGDDSHSSTSSVHGDSWPSPSFTDQRSTVFRHLNRDRDRSQNMPTSPFSTSAFRE